MEFSFEDHASIETSRDPALDAILEEHGELEARITVACEGHERGVDIIGVEVGDARLCDPDSDLKLKFLMTKELREAIRAEVETHVMSRRRDYEDRAAEHLQGLLEEAEDRRFEYRRENAFD
jgi:hypothetical protein